MYQRFRIVFNPDMERAAAGETFEIPPSPPETAELEKADPAPDPDVSRNQREEEFDAGIEGVYIISVAARILDMHPQTLRKYERLGLINPGRTVGMLRLYSREDIRKVFLIRHLMENLGLNLAGVEFALNLVENLHGFEQYLRSAAAGTSVEPVIETAMAQLFRNLNLPAE